MQKNQGRRSSRGAVMEAQTATCKKAGNIVLDWLPLYACCHMGLFTDRNIVNVFGFLTAHYLGLMSGVGVDWNYEQTASWEIHMDLLTPRIRLTPNASLIKIYHTTHRWQVCQPNWQPTNSRETACRTSYIALVYIKKIGTLPTITNMNPRIPRCNPSCLLLGEIE